MPKLSSYTLAVSGIEPFVGPVFADRREKRRKIVSAKKAPKKTPAKKTTVKKAVKKAVKKVAKKTTKKAAPKQTNIEKLTAAGVIREGQVEKHNHAVINKLSSTEVKTLIKLRSKLGSLSAAGDDSLSPNFPV
ncbi:MAG TPA: hypothetical protein VIM60_02555 [Edaphobacter sp.]